MKSLMASVTRELQSQAGEREVFAGHAEFSHGRVETSLHFVFHYWEFPRGIFWPICSCGWLPDDGFSTIEAASACLCERQRAEVIASVRHEQ